MATGFIKKLKAIVPSSMRVGDIGYKADQEHMGGGKDKFVAAHLETLVYHVVYNACGLARNVWTIRMWASRYHEIYMKDFYLYVQEMVETLTSKTPAQRAQIWECRSRSFENLCHKKLDRFSKVKK